jgi:hypothetical protein
VSPAGHDCSALDAAFEHFLVELAALQDEIRGRQRADEISPRDWGAASLREMAAGGDGLADLRAQLARSLGVGSRRLDAYHRQIRALMAALDLVLAAYGGQLADLAQAGCTTCGRATGRHYCEDCARDLNLETYDNPARAA